MTVTTVHADRVSDGLASRGIDAVVTFHMPNVRWLSGFTGSNAATIVGPGLRIFITDSRYVSQSAEQIDESWQRHIDRDLFAAIAEELVDAGPLRLGFEAHHLTVHDHERLTAALGKGVDLTTVNEAIESYRARKDPDEIAAMRRAASVADAALTEVIGRGLIGRTEREVATDLEITLRRLGADGSAFPPMVAAGAHAALPHAAPRDVAIPAGTLVVIDAGARLDGYHSDCTRTFAAGDIPPRHHEVYELTRRAQEAAIAAMRPGQSARAVDAAARDMIAAAGHSEHFGHAVGHGIGLEVGESPIINQRSDATLEAGMVTTIEPGVYVPGELGVRIEDVVQVTDDGPERLTSLPTSLQVIG
jgi:Xaa-Pro aminopeptidase